jgi:excisionase family DNA binding protein
MSDKRAENRLTLSVEETAALLGVSRNLAYKLARQGKLPGVIPIGQKRLVVSKAAIERLLEGQVN